MEIIYRVYEIIDDNGYKDKTILDQTICLCNSREHFKEIMRELYNPKKVHFANSRKLEIGDIYINIISENCNNTEQYFIVEEYTCAYCNKNFKSNKRLLLKIRDGWRLNFACSEKYQENISEIENMCFCSNYCREEKTKDMIQKYQEYAKSNDLMQDHWINRESFNKYKSGYIYMISKKSTNEFYVGQTRYVPIFRWGQHLLTKRFELENIEDYKFEVLEIVEHLDKLNEREAYWINKKRDENPELSLNIIIPKEKENNCEE